MGSEVPVTLLLEAVKGGNNEARDQLWAVLYEELHKMAKRQMAPEAKWHTLQATSLVHEAYLRLLGGADADWQNRRHFFGAAARAMRRIRVEAARRRKAKKRGEGLERVPLSNEPAELPKEQADPERVAGALDRLEERDPYLAEIVYLRYFAGLTEEETAELLTVSRRKVQLDWKLVRGFLGRELKSET